MKPCDHAGAECPTAYAWMIETPCDQCGECCRQQNCLTGTFIRCPMVFPAGGLWWCQLEYKGVAIIGHAFTGNCTNPYREDGPCAGCSK